jgi:hypothetical protein
VDRDYKTKDGLEVKTLERMVAVNLFNGDIVSRSSQPSADF